MNRRVAMMIGGGVAALGLLIVLGALFFTPGSVREHLDDNYRRTANSARSATYTSSRQPRDVVASIARAWKPAERLAQPSGHFLRYRNAIVAVVPRTGGGSTIHYDDAAGGYHRWYGYVGGYWGTYSGPAEGTRGGGPGAGK